MVTTTVTTVTTTAGDAVASAVTLGVVVVVAMIALLVSKELAAASDHPKARLFVRMSSIGMVPLLFALVGIVVARVSGMMP